MELRELKPDGKYYIVLVNNCITNREKKYISSVR